MPNTRTLKRPLDQRLGVDLKYVFVMSPRLGDSLISMVIVANLMRHGYQVKVVSDQIHALRRWFPEVDVVPAAHEKWVSDALGDCDVILHAYHADKLPLMRDGDPRSLVMDDWPVYRQLKNMVDIQVDICRTYFGIADVVRSNGMKVPIRQWMYRESDLVLIHPVASHLHKSWRPQRFMTVALQLQQRGFVPEFLVPAEALEAWRWVQSYGMRLRAYPTLHDVAERVAMSAWVIGNDSGIGHLASSLGIPAVSLAMRRSIATRWQPGWAPSAVVIPLQWMPGRYLKEKTWKYLLMPYQVLAAFDRLREACEPPQHVKGAVKASGSVTETLKGLESAEPERYAYASCVE
jgi:hypothetical protein